MLLQHYTQWRLVQAGCLAAKQEAICVGAQKVSKRDGYGFAEESVHHTPCNAIDLYTLLSTNPHSTPSSPHLYRLCFLFLLSVESYNTPNFYRLD